METQTLLQITVSLAIGLLLGLQRQRTEASIGGIRTFPFIALLGTVCGVMSPYPKNVKFSVLKYRHSNARSAPTNCGLIEKLPASTDSRQS